MMVLLWWMILLLLLKKVESDPIRRAKIGVYEFEVKVDSSKDSYYER